MIRFNIENQLKTQWEPILVRQLHLLLSPVLINVKFGEINLHMQHDLPTEVNYFCCEFQGYGTQNEIYYAFTQNSDGRVAIRDALSRIRRTIIRKNQHAILRTKKIAPTLAKQPQASVFGDF